MTDTVIENEGVELAAAGGDAALIAERDGLKAALDTANEEIRDLTAGKMDLEAQLKAAKAAATKARNEAKLSSAVQGPKARFFKLPKAGERPSAEELQAAIGEAETVEVVFCESTKDGGKEILGIAPVRVQGDAWRMRNRGEPGASLMLTVPVPVNGPAEGHAPYAVSGFGLVLDGKPALYAPRVNGQLTIGGGARVNIADDIIF